MKEKLNEALGLLLNAVEKGMDFAAAEVPVVVQELLRWIAVEHLIKFGLYVAFIIIGLCFSRYLFNLSKRFGKQKGVEEVSFCAFLGSMVSVGLSFIAVWVSIAYHLIPAIKVWVAPRLVLIDYIKEMIQ